MEDIIFMSFSSYIYLLTYLLRCVHAYMQVRSGFHIIFLTTKIFLKNKTKQKTTENCACNL